MSKKEQSEVSTTTTQRNVSFDVRTRFKGTLATRILEHCKQRGLSETEFLRWLASEFFFPSKKQIS